MLRFSRKRFFAIVTEAIVIALIVTAAVFLYRPGLYVGGSRMDEASLLVYPELMLRGKMPYRDFETFYGPANLCALAAAFRFFGTTVTAERMVGFVYRFAFFAALYFAARPWGKIAAGGAVALAMFLLLPLWLFANAWVMALALATTSISLLSRSLTASHRRLGVALAGLAAGVAIMFRIDIAPAVLVAAAILLFLLNRKGFWTFAIGMTAGCAPLLIWIIGAGPRLALENLFLYPVIYSNPGRRLPLFGEGSPNTAVLWAMAGAIALIILCSGLAVWQKHADRDRVALLAFGCLGAFTLPQAFQRSDDFHVAMSAPVTIAWLPVLAAAVVTFAGKRTLSSLFAGVTTVACLSVLFSICPRPAELVSLALRNELALSQLPEYAARAGKREFPLTSVKDAQTVTTICAEIARRSQPGQRLFIGPRDLRRTTYNNVYFYYLLPQLEPASYFIEMNPFSANRVDSRMAADIKTADWIILDTELNGFHEPNASEQAGSDAPVTAIR
ncbi:MAG: hypothetical protein QOI96_1373, partial [Verrucomicrobiota bacterium]